MHRPADRGDKSPLTDAHSMRTCSMAILSPNFGVSRFNDRPMMIYRIVLAVYLILLVF